MSDTKHMPVSRFHDLWTRIARAYQQCADDPSVPIKHRKQAAENAERAQHFAAIAKAEELRP